MPNFRATVNPFAPFVRIFDGDEVIFVMGGDKDDDLLSWDTWFTLTVNGKDYDFHIHWDERLSIACYDVKYEAPPDGQVPATNIAKEGCIDLKTERSVPFRITDLQEDYEP